MKQVFPAIMLATALAGCAALVKPMHVTPDEISIQYDAVQNTFGQAQAKADAHCAQTGRQAQVISQWDNVLTRGATFRCVEG